MMPNEQMEERRFVIAEHQEDEIEDEDDDEYDGDYSVEEYDDYSDEGRALKSDCRRISRNSRDFETFTIFRPLSDTKAILLGLALKENTQMYNITIEMTPREPLTRCGARILGLGIRYSQIKQLCLKVPYNDDDEYDRSIAMPTDAMKQIYLRPMHRLTRLTLQFPLTDNDAFELQRCLANNKSLFFLAVEPHHLSSLGAIALAKGIRASNIKYLEILGDPTDNTPRITKLLYLKGIQPSNIDMISIKDVVGDAHSLGVAIRSRMRSLSISWIEAPHWSQSQMQDLSQGLAQTRHLTDLSLRSSKLGDEHIRILSAGLQDNRSIRKLDLSKNCIGDVGVIALVESWSDQAIIRRLDLQGNLIGSSGAKRLLQASATLNLDTLILSYNICIGFEGLEMIGKVLPFSLLRALCLDDVVNWVDYEETDRSNLAKLQQDKLEKAAQAIVEGIRTNFSLEVLDVDLFYKFDDDYTYMSDVTNEIDFHLEMNGEYGRHRFLQNDHELPPACWCFLLAKYKGNKSVLFYFVRELPMLFAWGSRGNTTRKRRREGESAAIFAANPSE